jgi:hypothetical protein
MCKAVIPIMRERGGLVITVGSVDGIRYGLYNDFYCGTKFAIVYNGLVTGKVCPWTERCCYGPSRRVRTLTCACSAPARNSGFSYPFECARATLFSLQTVEALMEGMRYSVAADNIEAAVVKPGVVGSIFANRYEPEATELCGADDRPSSIARIPKLAAELCSVTLRGGQSNESCG